MLLEGFKLLFKRIKLRPLSVEDKMNGNEKEPIVSELDSNPY